MVFKKHVLKLLIMVIRMLMDMKCQQTGSNYEFNSENDYLHVVETEINEYEWQERVAKDDQG